MAVEHLPAVSSYQGQRPTLMRGAELLLYVSLEQGVTIDSSEPKCPPGF